MDINLSDKRGVILILSILIVVSAAAFHLTQNNNSLGIDDHEVDNPCQRYVEHECREQNVTGFDTPEVCYHAAEDKIPESFKQWADQRGYQINKTRVSC